MSRSKVLGLTVAALILSGGAQAAPVTETFDITANNFSNAEGIDPVPVDAVTGSFTLTFDPALVYGDTITGISGSLNLPLGSTLGFNYNPSTANGLLIIGGTNALVAGISPGTDDYFVTIRNIATANPILNELAYAESAFGGDVWNSRQGSLAAPEPLTLSLFGAGLAGAVTMRRRKRNA